MAWVWVSRAGSLGFAVSPVETAQQGGLRGVRASPGCGPWAHPAQEKVGGFWESQALTCPETGWRPSTSLLVRVGAPDERELIEVVRNKGSLSTASNSS